MIPIHTTTISIWRAPADSGDDEPGPYEPEAERVEVASGIRAQISSPAGRERVTGGAQEVVEFLLSCDPCDLNHNDRVKDEATGEMYEVTWARQRVGYGLDHTSAGLKQVTGVVTG